MAIGRLTRPRVLLVDDDSRLLHIVGLYLQVQQFDVFTASSGEEALTRLELGLPDLFIVDIMMPGIDGITLCRRIRARPDGGDVPIIVFTALSDAVELDSATRAGASRVITKPFSLSGLREALDELLPIRMADSA
jgi:CheY-like chemotaxis protein